MTREHIAALALAGLVASQPPPHPASLGNEDKHRQLAKEAVALADALIARLDETWPAPKDEELSGPLAQAAQKAVLEDDGEPD